MGLYVCDTFLADLRNHGDNGFAKRALSKILASNGGFRLADDDHRYNGIDDAWIRVISRGNTAWRAIYIRRGDDIFLYRVGEHSIEDNLSAPSANLEFRPLQSAIEEVRAGATAWQAAPLPSDHFGNRFLQNNRGRLLRSFMLGRRLIPHKEIVIISPTLSFAVMSRTHRLGMVLDDLMAEGTTVTLITRPPTTKDELQPFVDLETRGFKLSFHERLHAKLYLFEVTEDASSCVGGQTASNVAMLGSANLTEEGMGFVDPSQEELCYELPDVAYDHALEFALQIVQDSDDLRIIRDKVIKGNRR
ncbi:phospholipase D-like domain-containing protein [Pseudothauera rhizosphaerae]|uniref:Uncharacterized protein n=1 Tax=Pseudothauera rhizosphaerae TaxID=2565932 RepID=A0A4S4ALR2_9RHOO|nr:hypothetical protein [Pseudothauera rhizosphaerae]THF60382.1 hypothetical protein E6O51_14365 [Pseudothauera rhizosphaerae]